VASTYGFTLLQSLQPMCGVHSWLPVRKQVVDRPAIAHLTDMLPCAVQKQRTLIALLARLAVTEFKWIHRPQESLRSRLTWWYHLRYATGVYPILEKSQFTDY
jgi:hypothetical protein